ncbi:ornithine carbamoyltransferase [bacterium]|nr:MAG: ornithine carbamoyltransferase [bacterium]
MARHFLCLQDFSKEELGAMLKLAAELKARHAKGEQAPLLAGKTLGMIFKKNSTRTRVSFEAGMTQLGGHAIFLSTDTTQMGRGEPERDTARVLSRYVDAIMIRTDTQSSVEELARWATVPVINGLTDLHHPCQVMADMQTVIERLGTLEGITVAWIGDGNNMANSWIEAAGVMGFALRLACPAGYEPDSRVMRWAKEAGADISLTRNPLEAARGADVVNTDVWASMGQESEKDKRKKDFASYMVDDKIMALTSQRSIFLHCLPAYRGLEVSEEVLEGPRSAVWDQAENRLHVQKAILATLLGK